MAGMLRAPSRSGRRCRRARPSRRGARASRGRRRAARRRGTCRQELASTCTGSPTTTAAIESPSAASMVSRPPPWASTDLAVSARPSANDAPGLPPRDREPEQQRGVHTDSRVRHVGHLRQQRLAGRRPVVQPAVVAEQPAAVREGRGGRLVGRHAFGRGPDGRDRAGRGDGRRKRRERRVGPDRLGAPVADGIGRGRRTTRRRSRRRSPCRAAAAGEPTTARRASAPGP